MSAAEPLAAKLANYASFDLPPELDREAAEISNTDNASPLPLPVELFGTITPMLAGRSLIKGLLMAGSACVVFGAPGCGKSFLASDMGLHIAANLRWFGRRITGGGVVYLAAEGQGGFRARVEAWRRAHPDATEVRFALVPAPLDLLDPRADIAKLGTVLHHLAELWGGIALLIVDTLAATFGGGDENGSDMAAYVANVERLCAPYGCSSLIVTHSPLDATAKRPRGHSSLWGAADTVLHVSGDREAPARRLHVLKQKDGDPGPDLMFTLKQVEIGTDEDGDPVTSCVVEQSEIEPGAIIGKRRLSAKEMIVKAALDRAMVAAGVFPPSEIPDNVLNRVRTGKVVRTADWRAEALPALSSSDTKRDTARRTFDRARESLQASDIVGVWEDWAWIAY